MSERDPHQREKHLTDAHKISALKRSMPSNDDLNDMSQFFGFLADPTRLKIVINLKKSVLCVHEIAEVVGMSLSAVSHQLRLLKTAKMVKSRRDGKMVIYSLDDEHIGQLLSVADEHIKE